MTKCYSKLAIILIYYKQSHLAKITLIFCCLWVNVNELLEKGVFMEEFFVQLKEKKVKLDTFDIPADYSQAKCKNMEVEFKTWLLSKIN